VSNPRDQPAAAGDEPQDRAGRPWPSWLKLGLALGLLAATLWLVDVRMLWQRLRGLHVGWLGVAFAIGALQFALLAARWCFVARRLGLTLHYAQALGEYYLSSLLNFVSPVGVVADAWRALRHAQLTPERPPLARAALAVVLERASGQLALWLVALAVAPRWAPALAAAADTHANAPALALGALLALGLTALALARRSLARIRQLALEGGRAFFAPASLGVHLSLSLALIASHVALFMAAARALQLQVPAALALQVVPAMLIASTLFAVLGGFGSREAAAAALFHLAGRSAAEGVAISVVFGAVSVLGSLPGLLALRRRSASAPT
jgi:glycosyltransferase 2 family protein